MSHSPASASASRSRQQPAQRKSSVADIMAASTTISRAHSIASLPSLSPSSMAPAPRRPSPRRAHFWVADEDDSEARERDRGEWPTTAVTDGPDSDGKLTHPPSSSQPSHSSRRSHAGAQRRSRTSHGPQARTVSRHSPSPRTRTRGSGLACFSPRQKRLRSQARTRSSSSGRAPAPRQRPPRQGGRSSASGASSSSRR